MNFPSSLQQQITVLFFCTQNTHGNQELLHSEEHHMSETAEKHCYRILWSIIYKPRLQAKQEYFLEIQLDTLISINSVQCFVCSIKQCK